MRSVTSYRWSIPSNTRSDARYMRPWFSPGGRRKRLHTIGVRVSETRPEMSTDTPMTTANSWSSRPMTPPMKSTGMNTAASDKVIETMVKPISREPLSAASSRLSPVSMWRTMFSSITMASSTTKPTPRVRAISDRLSSV